MRLLVYWESPVAYPTDGQKYSWNETKSKLGI
jgi:hypothetical protein